MTARHPSPIAQESRLLRIAVRRDRRLILIHKTASPQTCLPRGAKSIQPGRRGEWGDQRMGKPANGYPNHVIWWPSAPDRGGRPGLPCPTSGLPGDPPGVGCLVGRQRIATVSEPLSVGRFPHPLVTFPFGPGRAKGVQWQAPLSNLRLCRKCLDAVCDVPKLCTRCLETLALPCGFVNGLPNPHGFSR